MDKPFTVDETRWIRLYIIVLSANSTGIQKSSSHKQDESKGITVSSKTTNLMPEMQHKLKVFGLILLSFFKSQKVTFDEYRH
jgi:hypothetical protein